MTGLKKSTLYALVKKNEFPAAVQVSPRCVAWRLSQVAAFIAERQCVKLKAPDGKTGGAQ